MTCIWHGRLGHMSRSGMETWSHFGYLPMLSFSNFSVCEHCQYGKQKRSVHQIRSDFSTQSLELVHTDICGPMSTRSFVSPTCEVAINFLWISSPNSVEQCHYRPISHLVH